MCGVGPPPLGRCGRLGEAGQSRSLFPGTLDQHPAIDYRTQRADGSDHRVAAQSDGGIGLARVRGPPRLPAVVARDAERAGRIADPAVLQDRHPASLHESRKPARVVLQRSRHRRLHSRRADARNGVARSAPGCDLPDAAAGSWPAARRLASCAPIAVSPAISPRTVSACPASWCAACSPRRPAARGRSSAASSSITARRSSSDGAAGTSPARTARRGTWATRW